jgi:hypothetical protein
LLPVSLFAYNENRPVELFECVRKRPLQNLVPKGKELAETLSSSWATMSAGTLMTWECGGVLMRFVDDRD